MVLRQDLSEGDREQIAKVCRPCDQFQTHSAECRALIFASELFAKIFEDRRCRPQVYLPSFLRRHLSRNYPNVKDEAEDIAQDVLEDLLENPPREPLPDPHLIGLQRILAARAVMRVSDLLREKLGRVRCGNCLHHLILPRERRECRHPDPDHHWSGRTVRASEDPRKFDPPCTSFASRRAVDGDFDVAAATVRDPELAPDVDAAGQEQKQLLLEGLVELQKVEPGAALVVYLSYFKEKTSSEIAEEMGTTVRTVDRCKQRGLVFLRSSLESRDIKGVQDLQWGAAGR